MKIALAACAKNPVLSASNDRLRQALLARGVDCPVLRWNADPFEDFLACDLTVLRQTWDYQDDPGGFAAWLVRLEALGGRVEAPARLAVWNNDKRTLVELERYGIAVPRTVPLPASGDPAALAAIPTERIVLKPAFGGDGIGVQLADRAGLADALERSAAEAPGRPLMAQEFLPEIGEGEWKLTCIAGAVALAVRARPKPGEFRINSRFQPEVAVVAPPEPARRAAEQLMAALGTPLCGRVDGVMKAGGFICTELELADPDLHLHLQPEAAETLADAVLARAQRPPG
ncbi:MAG: hypothetical protein AAFV49_14670 [Pseudomonadota bacterium]